MASGMLVNSNSVEKEEEETKALICSPTKCHGVNTPTVADFQLPMRCRQMQSCKEMHGISTLQMQLT